MLIRKTDHQEESKKTMSIKYKMIQRGDYLNPDDKKKTGYYPQVVRAKTFTTEELALIMAKGKRLQAYEVKGTIELLLACIEDELLNGNNVCLNGFGTFSLSAKCKRTVDNPSEVRAESIEIKKVAFTPSAPLRKRLKLANFVRAKE